jgi:hypothetical protein
MQQLKGVDTIDTCCQRCLANPKCTGYVWDTLKTDPTTRDVNCWLLSGPITSQMAGTSARVFARVGAAPPTSPPPTAAYQWPATTGLHQVGSNFLTSVLVDGDDWSHQPIYTSTWGFRASTTGAYRFSASRVTSVDVPLTNAARFCLREASSASKSISGSCLGEGSVDQRGGSGGWILIMGGVPLRAGQLYEMVLTWDPRQGGFAAADAILIESEVALNDGAKLDTPRLVVPPLDARIVKIDAASADLAQQSVKTDDGSAIASHLTMMSYYTYAKEAEIAIMHDWITTVSEQGTVAGAIDCWKNWSLPSLLGELPWNPAVKGKLASADALLMYGNALNRSVNEFGWLQPQWRTALTRWVAARRPLFENGTAVGIFTGDEMGWASLKVNATKNNQHTVSDRNLVDMNISGGHVS